MAAERESIQFSTRDAFRDWMRENQDLEAGIWLIVAKKGSPFATVSYAEALDVALEFGWIDGQSRSRDEYTSFRGFTPRRSASPWSMRNRLAAEAMIAEGRMAPRGRAEVERARADGRWNRAYAASTDAQPHPDFLSALEDDPAAKEFYATLNAQNRFAVYYRIHALKTDVGRARAIARLVDRLARGEKPAG
ncbi:YdeI family protein [Agreia sp.]|uniref:YdeI/OmpD-associated family protein n=1 Tax=Agreia sp. TaxID=1872416 RepID=UPI0035BC4574